MHPFHDLATGQSRPSAPKSSDEPTPPWVQPDPVFEHLLTHSSVYCYSIDYRTGRFRYVSPGIYRLLGYDRDTWQFGGPQEAFSHVHPEDQPCVTKIYAEIQRELLRQPMEIRFDLSFVYTCRLQTRAGHFLHLSHHLSFPTLDRRGRPLADFTLVSDISALKVPQICQLQIHHPHPDTPITKTLTFNCSAPAVDLTRREIEILQLVAAGLDSQEIASKLFISYHTVCTHRKNLLRKAGAKGTVELIGFGRGVGLV